MDTVKIGNFLRELRKEKNLTQEQLAEVFSVSNRTISRWETGSNMPDISLLLEIAGFYQLDVSEILNGERRPASDKDAAEDVTNETSALTDVAEYADSDKEKMALKTRIYSIVGLIAVIVNVMLGNFFPDDNGAIFWIKKLCTLMIYLALSAGILYTTERLQILQRKYKEKLRKNLPAFILIAVGAVALLLAIAPFFLISRG
ncbi:MAG: helix-turn-helix domain-containing protein [Lachnospiraceae bacterium]|nr:helix-turn-helix domain-containing protein [Lachnospiraceae bacterium]